MASEAPQKSYEPIGGQEGLTITAMAGEDQLVEISEWPHTPESGGEAALLAGHPLIKEEGAEDPKPEEEATEVYGQEADQTGEVAEESPQEQPPEQTPPVPPAQEEEGGAS